MSLRLTMALAFLMGIVVAASAATTITIGQRGMLFSPSSASLAKGDRIVFTNDDDVIHNIHIFTVGSAEKDLGLQKPGTTLNYTFDKAGAYRIRCNIHPSMKMAVTVK
jgi:plastocyanin